MGLRTLLRRLKRGAVLRSLNSRAEFNFTAGSGLDFGGSLCRAIFLSFIYIMRRQRPTRLMNRARLLMGSLFKFRPAIYSDDGFSRERGKEIYGLI